MRNVAYLIYHIFFNNVINVRYALHIKKHFHTFNVQQYLQMERILSFLQKSEKHNEMSSSAAQDDNTTEIKVHKYTEFPTKAWECIRVKQKFKTLTPIDRNTPVSKDHVRFVCISDTHTRIEGRHELIPDGDVLLHAGDITQCGSLPEVKAFNKFLGELPHKCKVVIAGNHDLTFDEEFRTSRRREMEYRFRISSAKCEDYLKKHGLKEAKDVLTNCIYLQDNSVNICGINIYGSPWQPEFCGWAFNLKRGAQCLEKWNMIPDTTDILITHGPPVGYGDTTYQGKRVGCVELLTTVQNRVKPAYHVFGHIHEGYGVTTDGQTVFINASTCTLKYRPSNPPIVFDYPLPEGVTKDELVDTFSNGSTLSGSSESSDSTTASAAKAELPAVSEESMDCDYIDKKLS